MNLLDIDTSSADYLTQWLATSWPDTAAQAYESYLTAGRGLLLVDLANGEPIPDFNLGLRARSEYLPLALIEQHAAGVLCDASALPALLGQVQAYDPEVEVIYCLTRKKGNPAFYTVGTEQMSAREAYEQRGQRPPQRPVLRGRVVGQG